jgi:hypothetical protein
VSEYPGAPKVAAVVTGTRRNSQDEILSFQWEGLVGAVGIEFASLTHKSFRRNGVAPPHHLQLVPIGAFCRYSRQAGRHFRLSFGTLMYSTIRFLRARH